MREVLLRLVDDSRMSIFKPSYGTNMLTAWADILGEKFFITQSAFTDKVH